MSGRALAVLVALACAATPARAELHLVTVFAHDSGFEAPTRVPSGATTLQFVNRGWEPHRMLILRLSEGVDETALRAALPLNDRSAPGIARLGGTGVHRGEGREALSLALRPGRYALLCDQHPVAEVHEFGVLDYEPAELTPGDWRAVLADDGIEAPAALPAGARWLRIENRGTRVHGLGLGRLRPGRSVVDARGWSHAPSGPPPWVRAGGSAPLSPGEAVLVEIPLLSGDYVLFAPSRDGGAQPDGFWHVLAVRQEH